MTGLYPPTSFSMAVLALGVGLLIGAIVAIGWMMIYFRTTRRPDEISPEATRLTLEEKAYRQYREALDTLNADYAAGAISYRDIHTAWAAIIRAAASLASGYNIEVATASDIRRAFPAWPQLADTIEACEQVTFVDDDRLQPDNDQLQRNFSSVVTVVNRLAPQQGW